MSDSGLFVSALPHLEEPIRAELFSVERLEQHAETLAAAQTVEDEPTRGKPLTPRVLENGRVLLECYGELTKAIQQDQPIPPAAEWLVDNFYIVDDQLREIREDLPPGFYRSFPSSIRGISQGTRAFSASPGPSSPIPTAALIPRFFAALLPLTSACSRSPSANYGPSPSPSASFWSRISAAWPNASCTAAQRASKPTSLPTNFSGAAGQANPDLSFAARPLKTNLSPTPSPFSFSSVCATSAPTSVRRSNGWTNASPLRTRTPTRSFASSISNRRAMNVTVRNIITSMRLMSAFEWPDFFESVSLVDRVLGEETNFAELDFTTRDSYRHAIEGLSRGSKHSEVEIAQRVVQHVKRNRIEARANPSASQERRTDPGYYLIAQGRPEFERELGYSPQPAQADASFLHAHGLAGLSGNHCPGNCSGHHFSSHP